MTIDIERITTISFDGDGTLWDFEKVMRDALQRTRDELCRLDSTLGEALTVESMIAVRNRVAGELKGRGTNLEVIRLEAFRRTLAGIGRPDEQLARHLNEVYLAHRFANIELFPDVNPALDALGARYRLGLLSNGNSYPDRCGLEGRFQFVVFAQDHGVEKPDPRIFAITLDRAGCTRGQLLHVGDSLQNDVFGAQRAGIAVVWLNRTGSPNTSAMQPDLEVRTLTDLADWVTWRNSTGC